MLRGGALLLTCANIKQDFKKIYGNDFDNNILKLAYINMLLHNDGITNLQKFDATSKYLDGGSLYNTHSFAQWVKNLKINKVIANPPYEHSFAIDILENVLNNVEPNSKIVWLMPNTKMEKIKKSKNILLKNTLTDIIFLGDKLFPKIACGDVCLFLFESAKPQNNQKIKCWHLNDGFKTVKNQGYQDVDGVWLDRKKEFLDNWKQGKFDFEIDSSQHLCYPKHFETTSVTKKDFEMTLLQYMLYKQGRISSQDTVNSTLQLLIDFIVQNNTDDKLKIFKKMAEKESNELKLIIWKKIPLKSIFKIKKCLGTKVGNLIDGEIPYVSRTSINNGITRMCGNKNLLNPKNTITIHAEWKQNYCAFYQEKNYVTDGMIALLSCEKLNKYNALFITTILSKTKYSGKGLKESLNNLLIKLPVSENDEIAWDYMEKYMKEKLD